MLAISVNTIIIINNKHKIFPIPMNINKITVVMTMAALFANSASAKFNLEFCAEDKFTCESKCIEKGGHSMEVSLPNLVSNGTA